MTVQKVANYLVYCLAADTKPTVNATNTLAYEVDTGAIYRWNGTAWVQMSPGLAKANTFTEIQKIIKDNGQQITFYRPNNTAGFGCGFYYNLNTSTGAEATYGNSYISLEDNTNGAHRGDFYVQLARAGALAISLRIYTAGNGGLIFGNNNRIQLDEGGLTSARVYTFPDATAQLDGINNTSTHTNKTISSASNTLVGVAQDPISKRWGSYQPGQGTGSSTIGQPDGILASYTFTGAGTNSNTFDTTEGVLVNLATAATLNQNAGVVSQTIGVGFGRRLFGARARIRSKVDISTSTRFYFGFTSATVLPISDTPLATTDHGIIVGFNSSDTAYQIYHNDGASTVTKDAVTGNIAKNTSFHTIEINWTAAGNINVIFDGTTQTISTDLPATTANLFFNAVAQNATAAIRTHVIKGVWIEADK